VLLTALASMADVTPRCRVVFSHSFRHDRWAPLWRGHNTRADIPRDGSACTVKGKVTARRDVTIEYQLTDITRPTMTLAGRNIRGVIIHDH